MDAAVRQLTAAVRALNVADDDIFVDFVAPPKIYGFELSGDIARERIEEFELKKTVSIRFRDHAMLDRLVLAAAQAQVYDLIKVDYIVSDISVVQQRLMEEAAAIIKGKAGRYEALLGIRVQPPAQIYAERHAIHYPPEMYDSYVAAESEGVSRPNLQRYTVQQARKGRTPGFSQRHSIFVAVIIYYNHQAKRVNERNPDLELQVLRSQFVILEPVILLQIHSNVAEIATNYSGFSATFKRNLLILWATCWEQICGRARP